MRGSLASIALALLLAGNSAAQPADQETVEEARHLIEEMFGDLPDQDLDQVIAKALAEEDRLALFNDCRPMMFLFDDSDLDDDDKRLGLTDEAMKSVGARRLQEAGLFSPSQALVDLPEIMSSQLVAQISREAPAIHVSLSFSKRVTDEFGTVGQAVTWRQGATGTIFSDASVATSALTQILDRFIAKFMRVNAAACARRWETSP